MTRRILLATAAGALLLGLAGRPAGAQNALHRDLLTFNVPIAIPGAVLAPGTYSFEVPDAAFSPSLVRIRSKDGKHVYLTQFARVVYRLDAVAVPHVTFGEAAPGAAKPINMWFPIGEDSGRQFIYN